MILTLDFIFVTLGSQKMKTQHLQTTEGKGYSPDTPPPAEMPFT